MTTKRTHGPCHGASGGCEPDSMGVMAHTASCPSLYPVEQEPDALTRLARHVRTAWLLTPNATNRISVDDFEEQALALISEAREEQRKAVAMAAQTHVRDGDDSLDDDLKLFNTL